MYAYKILAALTVSAILAVTMTMPEQLAQSLPGQISQEGESPVVARIGKVVDIIESSTITVEISGSPTLVEASYLFPQYQPLLGDLVYVTKQDAQWFILGTMSGDINSMIANPSFEIGTNGALPTNWTISVIASAGGVPTFTKEFGPNVSGDHYGLARATTAGAGGLSVMDLFSSPAFADDGQRWVMSYYLTYAYINTNAASVSQSGDSTIESYIQFLDSGGVLLAETSVNFIYLGANVINKWFARTTTLAEANFVTAPPGTASARIRMRFRFTNSANSQTSMGIDHMILRHS